MGASILYPNHMKNPVPNLPAKSFITNFLAWEPIFLRSESAFLYKNLLPCKFSAKTVHGASQTSKIRHFTRFFTHFRDPDPLRIGQSLYPAHIHHSQLSSIAIGPLYLQHAPPTSLSPNFFEIFSRYSQSLYKTHTRENGFSSLPIGFFHIQHRPPPITASPKFSERPSSENSSISIGR